MLSGTIFITSDFEKIKSLPVAGGVMVISLDEDNRLSEISPNIIEGTCLLPPVEAKIAEVDGDMMRYDEIYLSYLYTQQDFMSAIVAFLYKGGNMIIYLPEDYSYTKDKFCEFIFKIYGIHIGDMENHNYDYDKCFYDLKSIPFWLNMMFKRDIISWLDWTRLMPLDAISMDGVIGGDKVAFNKAVYCMNPYYDGDISLMYKEFIRFFKVAHINPNAVPAISMEK